MKLSLLLILAFTAACGPVTPVPGAGGAFTPLTQPPARAPECAPGGGDSVSTNVYFEFQVERTAAINTAGGRSNGRGRGEVLVNFVVDTNGVVLDSTLKAVYEADRGKLPSVRRAVAQLEFKPAELNSCRVRQLVQQPGAPR